MKKIAAFFYFAVSFFLLIPASISAAGGKSLTLEHALRIAMAHNPALTIARSEVDAARAKVTDAKSAYLPQVVVTGRADRYDDGWRQIESPVDLTRNGTRSSRTTDEDYSAYALNLAVVQQICDFGKSRNQLAGSRNRLDASRFDLNDTSMALVRDVKYSYFDVLKNQGLVEVNQEALQVQQKHLEQAQALFNQGLRPKIDVTSTETEVSRARLDLIKAQYALQKELAVLEQLLGGPPVTGNYTLVDESVPIAVYDDLGALIQLALKNRPDIAGLASRIKSAEAGLQAARAGYWPTLNAEGGYTFSGTEFPLEESWQAGIALKWTLFSGFKIAAKVSEAGADIRLLQARFKYLKDVVTKGVRQARLAVQEARETIATAKAGLKQATENLAVANGRYLAGVSDAVEYSDAQMLYTQARSAMVQAKYGLYKAVAGLDFAAGITPQ